MEIDTIIYKAKDGKLFQDPLQCEEYEKTIGIIPGSVGALIQALEKLGPKTYIFGVVFMKGKEETAVFTRCTVCCDNILEDYVNVENLREDQRYMYETADEFVEVLKKMDKDNPCQYMIVFSKDIDFKKTGIMALSNPEAWKKEK